MSKRLSLILGDHDVALLERFTAAGTAEHSALEDWALAHVMEPVSSEAAALRILLKAGAGTVSEGIADVAYAQLALEYSADSAAAERRSARTRYADRTEAHL